MALLLADLQTEYEDRLRFETPLTELSGLERIEGEMQPSRCGGLFQLVLVSLMFLGGVCATHRRTAGHKRAGGPQQGEVASREARNRIDREVAVAASRGM